MIGKAAAAVQVLEAEPPSVLDAVIEETAKRLVEEPIPPGFTLLPAGVLRRLRVNKAWIQYGDYYGLPWIIETGGIEAQYKTVEVLGKTKAVTGERREGIGCCASTVRFAAIETTAAILVS